MTTKFKVGDKVKIINSGQLYSTYDTWTGTKVLKNWISDYGRRGKIKDMVGKISCIESHSSKLPDTLLAGVELDNGHSVIMGLTGLEIVKQKKHSKTGKYSLKNLAKCHFEEVEVLPEVNDYGIYKDGMTEEEIKKYLVDCYYMLTANQKVGFLERTSGRLGHNTNAETLYRGFATILSVHTAGCLSVECQECGRVNCIPLTFRLDVDRYSRQLFFGYITYFD
jgi:hypothetical protein